MKPNEILSLPVIEALTGDEYIPVVDRADTRPRLARIPASEVGGSGSGVFSSPGDLTALDAADTTIAAQLDAVAPGIYFPVWDSMRGEWCQAYDDGGVYASAVAPLAGTSPTDIHPNTRIVIDPDWGVVELVGPVTGSMYASGASIASETAEGVVAGFDVELDLIKVDLTNWDGASPVVVDLWAYAMMEPLANYALLWTCPPIVSTTYGHTLAFSQALGLLNAERNQIRASGDVAPVDGGVNDPLIALGFDMWSEKVGNHAYGAVLEGARPPATYLVNGVQITLTDAHAALAGHVLVCEQAPGISIAGRAMLTPLTVEIDGDIAVYNYPANVTLLANNPAGNCNISFDNYSLPEGKSITIKAFAGTVSALLSPSATITMQTSGVDTTSSINEGGVMEVTRLGSTLYVTGDLIAV